MQNFVNIVKVDSRSLHSKVKDGEVKLVPGNLDGCRLFLPCEEKSYNLTFDHSGHENHGTVYGAVTATAKVGKGLSFDGIDDYVSCGNVMDVTNKLTIMCWAKVLAGSAGNMIGKFESSSKRWHIYALDSQHLIYWNIGGNTFGTSPLSALIGDFHHFAMVYDGELVGNQNRLKAYIDGIQISLSITGTIPDALPLISGNVLVGRHSTSEYFKGILDEIRLFDKALTGQEIANSFDQES